MTAAYHRSMILAELGRSTEAVAALEEALRISPYFSPVGAAAARKALTELEATP